MPLGAGRLAWVKGTRIPQLERGTLRGHAPDTPPTMDAFNLCTVRTNTNSTQQGRHATALRAVDTN